MIAIHQWLYLQDGWGDSEHWRKGNRVSYQITGLSEGGGCQQSNHLSIERGEAGKRGRLANATIEEWKVKPIVLHFYSAEFGIGGLSERPKLSEESVLQSHFQ